MKRAPGAVAVLLVWVACKSGSTSAKPPPSDIIAGAMPVSKYQQHVDGGLWVRSISIALDQQPAGSASTFTVSPVSAVHTGPDDRFALPSLSCPNRRVGTCVLVDCTALRGANAYPFGTLEPQSAGAVVAKGGRTLTFTLDGGSRYPRLGGNDLLYTAGQVVEVAAPGGQTPAFTTRLYVPRPVELQHPLVDQAGASVRLRRDVPFEVRWSPLPNESPERVAISLSDHVQSITCRFDAAAGVGRFTPEMLGSLAAGPGLLSAHSVWGKEEVVDGWLLSLLARHVMVRSDGGTAFFPSLDIE